MAAQTSFAAGNLQGWHLFAHTDFFKQPSRSWGTASQPHIHPLKNANICAHNLHGHCCLPDNPCKAHDLPNSQTEAMLRLPQQTTLSMLTMQGAQTLGTHSVPINMASLESHRISLTVCQHMLPRCRAAAYQLHLKLCMHLLLLHQAIE